MGYAGLIQAGVQNFTSGLDAYNQGMASYEENKLRASAAEANASAQAAVEERKARINDIKAGQEQIKGEQEANKRSRQLAQEIGSTYANWAGNGLMVDGGSSTDTLGSILSTQKQEAQFDINTINENTGMNVWTYMANANVNRASAGAIRLQGNLEAGAYKRAAKAAKESADYGLMQSITGIPAPILKAFGATRNSHSGPVTIASGGGYSWSRAIK